MADRIELKGLEAYGYHGVFEHERRQGQHFLADVTCWLDCQDAAKDDDLTKTVHYGDLAKMAHAVLTGTPRDLIETVAAEIADTAMDMFPMLIACEVTIHKPQAPIPLTFEDVAVVARRSRR